MVGAGGEVLTQLRKGVLDYAVLACLERDEAYGLELLDRLHRFPHLRGADGSLYPLLARLRRRGLITDRWQPSEVGPSRRYYGLTAHGEEALQRFHDVWSAFSSDVDRLLAKGDRP